MHRCPDDQHIDLEGYHELEIPSSLNMSSMMSWASVSGPETGPLTIRMFHGYAIGSNLSIVGQRNVAAPQLFKAKEFNFEKLGIGGLDDQFEQIFRRAFASRVFPPSVVERLGIRHVKGVLLFGPPGTGEHSPKNLHVKGCLFAVSTLMLVLVAVGLQGSSFLSVPSLAHVNYVCG